MANFGRGKILDIDTGHSIVALRNAGSSEQTIGDDQVDIINLAGSNSSIAGGNGPSGDEADTSALQAEIDALSAQVEEIEEDIQEQEDYQNGVKFIHRMNHTGDYRVGTGSSSFEWIFYTSFTLHAEYSGGGFFNVYPTLNYVNFAYGEIGDDASTFAPSNVQGAIVQLQAVGPDATQIGDSTGSWFAPVLGMNDTGDKALLQARFQDNPSNVPGVVTTTGWVDVGELINTGNGLTWLFTGGGGSTTVDDRDGA